MDARVEVEVERQLAAILEVLEMRERLAAILGSTDLDDVVGAWGGVLERMLAIGGDEEGGAASIGVELNINQVWLLTAAYNARFGPVLAGVGAGAWPDVPSACNQLLQITGSTRPQRTDVYQQLYPYYQGLYTALAPTFHGVAG